CPLNSQFQCKAYGTGTLFSTAAYIKRGVPGNNRGLDMGGFRKRAPKSPAIKDAGGKSGGGDKGRKSKPKNETKKEDNANGKADKKTKDRDVVGRDSPARRRSLLGIASMRDVFEQVQDSLTKSRHADGSGGARSHGISSSPQRGQPASPGATATEVGTVNGWISPPQKKKALELKLPSGPSLSLRMKKTTAYTPSPASEFKARERQEPADLPHCSVCATPFALLVRRQRCQVCGESVCAQCSLDRRYVEGQKGLQRVCDICIVEGPIVFSGAGDEESLSAGSLTASWLYPSPSPAHGSLMASSPAAFTAGVTAGAAALGASPTLLTPGHPYPHPHLRDNGASGGDGGPLLALPPKVLGDGLGPADPTVGLGRGGGNVVGVEASAHGLGMGAEAVAGPGSGPGPGAGAWA
ncbi:unnamed protein product, partial [Discosporangium mesarthrocarpum]